MHPEWKSKSIKTIVEEMAGEGGQAMRDEWEVASICLLLFFPLLVPLAWCE